MTLLMSGVVLWCVLHFVPSLARPLRQSLIDRIGNNAYRGLFSLLLLSALAMIVFGWRSTPEVFIYQLPTWSRTVGMLLMVVAFILLGASHYQTAIKRLLRHPMLTGVIVWSVSHLLTNGTTRAMVLFGGIGVWALLEILLINRREGDREKPQAPPIGSEIRGVLVSLVIFAIVVYFHKYFAGVPLITSPVID